MEKITMLGTGSAMVTKCYNTCFTISKDENYFLVDTGGGNTILTNLEKCNVSISNLHHVFISHSHNDHIMGVIWIIRAVSQQILEENYEENLIIYCHKDVKDIILTISSLILQKKFTKFIGTRILFIDITDGYTADICNWKVTFFDIRSDKHLQFGFTMNLLQGKKLTFLGDEPYRDSLESYSKAVDFLLHEAFCLYSEKDVFKPYEKFHATVKDACVNAERLQVKNLLLFHTVDSNISKRKEQYITEGREFYHGNILVPDDLEVIELK